PTPHRRPLSWSRRDEPAESRPRSLAPHRRALPRSLPPGDGRGAHRRPLPARPLPPRLLHERGRPPEPQPPLQPAGDWPRLERAARRLLDRGEPDGVLLHPLLLRVLPARLAHA